MGDRCLALGILRVPSYGWVRQARSGSARVRDDRHVLPIGAASRLRRVSARSTTTTCVPLPQRRRVLSRRRRLTREVRLSLLSGTLTGSRSPPATRRNSLRTCITARSVQRDFNFPNDSGVTPRSWLPARPADASSGLRHPFAHRAVGQQLAVGTAPLDPAALELLVVERGV